MLRFPILSPAGGSISRTDKVLQPLLTRNPVTGATLFRFPVGTMSQGIGSPRNPLFLSVSEKASVLLAIRRSLWSHASRVCSAGLKPQVEMLLGEVYKVASRRATHMSKVRSSKHIPVATDENRGKRINRAAFHKGFTGHYSTTSRGSLSRRNARLLLLSAKRCFHSLGRCVCVCVCLPASVCLPRSRTAGQWNSGEIVAPAAVPADVSGAGSINIRVSVSGLMQQDLCISLQEPWMQCSLEAIGSPWASQAAWHGICTV